MSQNLKSNHHKKKYIVYENDLKFQKFRNLDPEKIIWSIEDLEKKYYNENLDTPEYRYKECIEKNNQGYLDLSHLNLKKIPQVPKQISITIKYLFLNNNELEDLNGIEQFVNLEVLDVSNNNLIYINNIPNTLLELTCRFNKINKLPILSKLKILDCTSNKITRLEYYPNIEILICQDNEIKNIPEYPFLKKLICRNNKLEIINSYEYLEYLDCSFNNIVKINKCSILKDLLCRNNKLNSIPEELFELKYLDIHDNYLNILEFYPKLKELYCNVDGIKKLSSKYKVLDSNVYSENKCYILFE